MHPELFKLPFIDLTVKSYGVMMVLGFFLAIVLLKWMCKRVAVNHETLINGGFYCFIVGIVGARIFHVIHYYDSFGSVFEMLAIWKGGLELLGGVIPSIIFIILYLKFKKLDVPLSLDIFATVLMVGIAFGRFGCFFNGCCFGLPTDSLLGVVFPYNSIPYQSQAYPDYSRNRNDAIIDISTEYYGYLDSRGDWHQAPDSMKYDYGLKPKELLTDKQSLEVAKGGKHSCRAVHPTQLYSSFGALFNCGVLLLFWWNLGSGQTQLRKRKFPPGTTSALMLILYAIFRFGVEKLRGDNPYEVSLLTVSQLLSVGMFICGLVLFAAFCRGKKRN